MTIKIERTKKGYPALWESGGGWTSTGETTLVAGPNGEPKRPIFTRERGPLACANHALFPLKKGDLILHVKRWRSEVKVKILRVLEINQDTAEVELVHEFHGNRDSSGLAGEWVPSEPTGLLKEAVLAGVRKAYTYHARSPVWLATSTTSSATS